MEEQKSLKEYAKEAKKRLKSGFWDNYKKDLEQELKKAEETGVSSSRVRDYFTQKVKIYIKSGKDENEEFYLKVKKILDEEGEIPDAIGRLTDKKVFDELSYEEKQRYSLNLSEKYLQAVERYNKEKAING